jgi:two-component system, OmpR family, sensor histidine kinase MtrB
MAVNAADTAAVGRAKRKSRFSLPARLALAFALGAGLATSLVGGSSYFLVRAYLLDQRDKQATTQALSNAELVRDALRDSPRDIPSEKREANKLLNSLRSEPGSFTLMWLHGEPLINPGCCDPQDLPATFTKRVLNGRSGRQRFILNGKPQLVIGVPMPAVDAVYAEVVPLDQLERILATLRNSVIGGTLAALMVGATLGAWTARRVLKPVTEVALAAEKLASGALDTRLVTGSDPDLNRVATSFNSMVDAVQRRIEREERFASDVSHELRTPLGTMSAAAQVLERRRGEMPERAAAAVDVITGQLKRLSQMVLDLLEIARIDAGVADVHLESCAVASLTRRIMDGHGAPQSLLSVNPGVADAEVMADPRRLEQIVRNLLDNADKYGGGATAIRISGSNRWVTIAVEDHGPGVADSERQRIFERFARGRAAQDTPGTGLGLALASDQAELINARLGVTDNRPRGAVFTLTMERA